MSFDPKDFRRALGKFPTGVTIITTRDNEGKPIGMTASSFNTLSIEPKLILWSIDKSAWSIETFTKSKSFAINVLRSDQVELSNRFARRGEDKFAGLTLTEGVNGSPLLDRAVAWFECTTWNVYEGGDHFIIVGKVDDYAYEENASSLAFYNGRYAVPEANPAIKAPNDLLESREFLADNLLYLLRQTINAYTVNFYPLLNDLDVSTEEWRVLTLLADGKPMEQEKISNFVSQPIKELLFTGERLQDKTLLEVEDSYFTLTSKGLDLARQLLNKASEHEMKILTCLSDEQQKNLKESLRLLHKTCVIN